MARAGGAPEREEAQHLLNGKSNLMAVEGEEGLRTEPIGSKSARWCLGAVMWAIVVFYVAMLLVMPMEIGTGSLTHWTLASSSSWTVMSSLPYYGFAGVFAVLWGGPVILLVFCALVYLHLFPRSSRRPTKRKNPRASLGAHPIIVSGPFGVLSMAELLCILVFIAIITWIFVISILRGFQTIERRRHQESFVVWEKQLKMVGLRLGFVGQICLGLLFLPVARGSVLLRLVDIPFEHAAKYHVWLGHFTMTVFSLHGLAFSVAWAAQGNLIERLLAWEITGIAHLPGVISLLAGFAMWMTAFQFTRIHAFELFFYTHQLYIVFIIFMALHVGDILFGMVFAGVLLFTFDRFLRFCQSRKEVGVLSAKVLPCGTFELVLPKPSNLKYNALSFCFLNFPSLGWLQWHPFSVSSSPEDSPDKIKFLVKPLGTWTQQLNEVIGKAVTAKCPLRLKAAVEGPYGHETSYFLDYEALLLVAGGIGVSPFIAIIRDLLHRYQKNEPSLPKDVTLIWAVKSKKELGILDSLSPTNIFPDYASRLNLIVKAYVTKEMEEDVEAVGEEGFPSQADHLSSTQSTAYNPAAAQKSMSHLVGSGDILWVGAAIAASIIGYVVVIGLIGRFYLLPVDHNSYHIVAWWVRGAIVSFGVLFGVWFFGGSVILLWHLVSSRSTDTKELSATVEPLLGNSREYAADEIPVNSLVNRTNTVYGNRPDLHEGRLTVKWNFWMVTPNNRSI